MTGDHTETLPDGTTITYTPSATSPNGYKRIITPLAKPKRKPSLFTSKPKTTMSGAAASSSMFAGLPGFTQTVASPADPPAGMMGTIYAPSVRPAKWGLFSTNKPAYVAKPLPNPDQPVHPTLLNASFSGGLHKPRLLPKLEPAQALTNPSTDFLTNPHPLPANLSYLSRGERKYYVSMQKEQAKAVKALQKAELKRLKAERKETEKVAKLEQKKLHASRKEELKQLKELNRYPHRPRPLPPVNYPAGMGGLWGSKLPPSGGQTTQPAAQPKQTAQPVYSFMLLPTLEEFGVRRPLDASGRPEAGKEQWPMMSRTMAMALVEQERDQQLKMAGRGQIYGFW